MKTRAGANTSVRNSEMKETSKANERTLSITLSSNTLLLSFSPQLTLLPSRLLALSPLPPSLPPHPYSCANSGTLSLVTCPPKSSLFLICTSGDK